MGLLESVIAGILSRVVYDEATAWSPKLSRMLVMLAVKTMPKLQRDRCHEEWQAWIDECSGHVSKIVAALGFLIVAQRTNIFNVGVALRALLQTGQYERGFLAGLSAGYNIVVAECNLTLPMISGQSADTVSLHYIVRMRLRRVLNIALGNQPYDGVGRIANRALNIDLEAVVSNLANK